MNTHSKSPIKTKNSFLNLESEEDNKEDNKDQIK